MDRDPVLVELDKLDQLILEYLEGASEGKVQGLGLRIIDQADKLGFDGKQLRERIELNQEV